MNAKCTISEETIGENSCDLSSIFFFYKSMVCVIQSPKLLPIQCHPMLPANSRMSGRT